MHSWSVLLSVFTTFSRKLKFSLSQVIRCTCRGAVCFLEQLMSAGGQIPVDIFTPSGDYSLFCSSVVCEIHVQNS